MDKDKTLKYWQKICRLKPNLIDQFGFPLTNFNPGGKYFNLSSLNLPDFEFQLSDEISKAQPSFKEVTDDILMELTLKLQRQTDMDCVSLWAEKLMRFCEIRLPTLRKRAFTKMGSRIGAKNHLLRIASFLLDFYFSTQDLRYLNTVLKITDQKWIANSQKLGSGLTFKDQRLEIALYEFRVLLLTTYALDALAAGEKP